MARTFYETGDAEVDIVVSRGTVSQRSALTEGSVDAAFGRVTGTLPAGIERISCGTRRTATRRCRCSSPT